MAVATVPCTDRAALLGHLERLVGFDTRNPPRAIGTGGIFDYLRQALPGFTHIVTDHGAGAVSLLAVRGQPVRVFNFHVDTVPAAEGWQRDPHRLVVEGERVYGLGACDIKGAAAAMLIAANATRGDCALLFSSDEEANDARCVAAFLAGAHGMREAIVAEPTQCRARLMHRGIVSGRARFAGIAGHASERRALNDSAVHRAVRWAQRALTEASALDRASFEELAGLPFNIGRIDGGVKANMIAAVCELRFNFRPLPSQAPSELFELFANLAPPSDLVDFEQTFCGPPLPAAEGDAARVQLAAARALADSLGLPLGPAVDFWSEASLFSSAGLTALVFGPGDIAQAHTADEWVALEQLDAATATYCRIIDDGR